MTVEGRIVGLDVGDVRIGVAVSDPLGFTAQGREVITRTTLPEDLATIARIVHETGAVRVVAGLPLNQHGEEGPQAIKVQEFLNELRKVIDAEVVTQDERFTTAAAERMLIQADVSRGKRKKVIDKVAAQGILQVHLDRAARERERGA